MSSSTWDELGTNLGQAWDELGTFSSLSLFMKLFFCPLPIWDFKFGCSFQSSVGRICKYLFLRTQPSFRSKFLKKRTR